jgi:hypothetical protein
MKEFDEELFVQIKLSNKINFFCFQLDSIPKFQSFFQIFLESSQNKSHRFDLSTSLTSSELPSSQRLPI